MRTVSAKTLAVHGAGWIAAACVVLWGLAAYRDPNLTLVLITTGLLCQ